MFYCLGFLYGLFGQELHLRTLIDYTLEFSNVKTFLEHPFSATSPRTVSLPGASRFYSRYSPEDNRPFSVYRKKAIGPRCDVWCPEDGDDCAIEVVGFVPSACSTPPEYNPPVRS